MKKTIEDLQYEAFDQAGFAAAKNCCGVFFELGILGLILYLVYWMFWTGEGVSTNY